MKNSSSSYEAFHHRMSLGALAASLFLGFASLVLILVAIFYMNNYMNYRHMMEAEAEGRSEFYTNMLGAFFSEVMGDCLFLSASDIIFGSPDSKAPAVDEHALSLLLTGKSRYRSISYFDNQGELVGSAVSPGFSGTDQPLTTDLLARIRMLADKELLINVEGSGSAALWKEPLQNPLVYFWMPVSDRSEGASRYFLQLVVDFNSLRNLFYLQNGSDSFSRYIFTSLGTLLDLEGNGTSLPKPYALRKLINAEPRAYWIDGDLLVARRFMFSGFRSSGGIKIYSDIFTLVTMLPVSDQKALFDYQLYAHIAWFGGISLVLIPFSILIAAYKVRKEEAEERLLESIRIQSAILKALPDSILQVDRDGIVTSVQVYPDAARIFTRQEFPGRADEIFPGELAYKIGYYADLALEQHRETLFEYRFEGERGFYFEFRFVAAGEADVLLILRNKTEEREQQRKLYTTGQFLEAYRRAMDAGSLVAKTDSMGRIIYMNRHFRDRFGLNYTKAAGRDLMELMDPVVRERGLPLSEDPLERMAALSGIITCHGCGDVCYIDNILLPVRDENGKVREIISFGHDVTELKNAENARSAFIARMSHEMRTPLNCIIGFSEVASETVDPDQGRSYARMIREESETLLTLVNQVLDLSKIEAGKLVIQPKPFELNGLLDSLAHTHAALAAKRGIAFSLYRTDMLPRFLFGDSLRIRQVLNNLLGNAVKFTEVGEVVLAVNSSINEGRCNLHFEVSDTGIGIPPNAQPHIFDSFYQVDGGETRKYGGTGLGTTIARQLVEQMGGRLMFTSTPGKGSRFWFDLSLEAAEDPVVAVKERIEPQGFRIDLKGRRILIAEDYRPNAEVLIQFLKHTGAEILLARNGREAVDLFREEAVDLVLMDIHMPSMDGYEAAMKIREMEKAYRQGRTPIIGVTADAFRRDIQRCFDSGMDRVLVKPLRREKLFRTLAFFFDLPAEYEEEDRELRQNRGLSAGKIMDREALLREVRDEEVADELIQGFIEALGHQIKTVGEARESGDWKTLHREAHSVKGGSAALYAEALRQAALRLEQAAKREDLPEIDAALPEFIAEAERFLQQIQFS
ncbi:ATP-binding protein [Marispirochaeta aestuarii]|uniref:ATP-binding protein n=1 Tax=Marispirochaeta aestuarii TaxID=1963862 RepID=UPI0029C98394|nr:ATP-binding protein [Marispirochaeta aestuarii]